jgi:hypothetical protein
VVDSRHFGNPKVFEFGDKTGGDRSSDSAHCAQCEAMLADALDGTLSAADQALFDEHMEQCGPCSQLLADARRGAAFLEMLRKPAPEPPVALLERILAQTGGEGGQAVPGGIAHVGLPIPAQPSGQYGIAALVPGQAVAGAVYGNVVPFPRRVATAFRTSSFGQIMLQPRLAMTAAMAFFSIALTMNLTGVHLQDLRASDLKPSSLKRDFYAANSRVARYYEGLRVVYELESRVHDLESAQDSDAIQPASPSAPVNTNQAPSAQPGPSQQPDRQKAAPQPGSNPPGSNPPARKQAAPNPGTSRREDLRQNRRLPVAEESAGNPGHTAPARMERTLV